MFVGGGGAVPRHNGQSKPVFLMMFNAGMWVLRPGLGLETDQDHFFEVLVSTLLVLVLVSEGGLE